MNAPQEQDPVWASEGHRAVRLVDDKVVAAIMPDPDRESDRLVSIVVWSRHPNWRGDKLLLDNVKPSMAKQLVDTLISSISWNVTS